MSNWEPDAIEPLVERLSSEDAFDRLNAAEELYSITRQTLGFRFNDSPKARAAAIDRWKELIDSRRRESEATETLRTALELSGAKIEPGALKHMLDALPSEKIQGYLQALLTKMKAHQARCEACHSRPATVRVTELGTGRVRTRHYCDLCARERGDALV